MKYCTINKRSNGMLEVSKVVFAAFTQHCIHSNVACVGGVENAYRAPQYRLMLLMSKVLKVAQYTL